MTVSFKQFVSKARLNEDAANDHKTDPPVLLTLRRKTVRNFPDGQKVALYYIKALDQYISIPFNQRNQPQGLPSLSTEEIEDTGTNVLEEAKKKKKASTKPKEPPYDFMKHLKDIAKMGHERHKPLRFVSGQKHIEDPETAQMVLDFHKAVKPINQGTMHKMMTRSKEGYHKVRMTAIGWAARPTVKKS